MFFEFETKHSSENGLLGDIQQALLLAQFDVDVLHDQIDGHQVFFAARNNDIAVLLGLCLTRVSR